MPLAVDILTNLPVDEGPVSSLFLCSSGGSGLETTPICSNACEAYSISTHTQHAAVVDVFETAS
jgi:hypothetical protein